MTLTEKLIELINVKPITEDDLAATAWFVLDGLANTVAGTNSPQGRILTEWFRAEAADVNRTTLWLGGLMHILEVDDLHRQSVVHPGGVVIPATVAVGLREGASGRQMLEAVLKGFEACTRVGNSVGPTVVFAGDPKFYQAAQYNVEAPIRQFVDFGDNSDASDWKDRRVSFVIGFVAWFKHHHAN